MHTDFHNTIGGLLPVSQECRYGVNPATGEPSEPVPISTRDDVEMAMAAAKKASRSWGKVPFEERRRILLEFCKAIESHRDQFARLLTREQGKPVSPLRSTLLLAIANICLDFPRWTGSHECTTLASSIYRMRSSRHDNQRRREQENRLPIYATWSFRWHHPLELSLRPRLCEAWSCGSRW